MLMPLVSGSTTPTTRVFICAGEVSGDRLAAGLVQAVHEKSPEIFFTGMGGPQMRIAGVETLVDLDELSIVGFWEALVHYPRLRRLLKKMETHLEQHPPDLLVLVDFVEFNLRLGQFAKSRGIPVLFYVSPQIWAWRPQRIHRIKRSIDVMAVLFPFEVAIYEKENIPVRYVGNPLLDTLQEPRKNLVEALQIPVTARRIGLLPGSRNSEIHRHWPLLVETARRMHRENPDLCFLTPLAPGVTREHLEQLASWEDLPLRVLDEPFTSHEVMASSELVLICSGTATLEAALLQVPMLVIYKTSAITYALGRRLITVPHIALANIVAGTEIVPEFIQQHACAEVLTENALNWLSDPQQLAKIRADLGRVKKQMGSPGADGRVADLVFQMLRGDRIQ